jgi:hypothetical protein
MEFTPVMRFCESCKNETAPCFECLGPQMEWQRVCEWAFYLDHTCFTLHWMDARSLYRQDEWYFQIYNHRIPIKSSFPMRLICPATCGCPKKPEYKLLTSKNLPFIGADTITHSFRGCLSRNYHNYTAAILAEFGETLPLEVPLDYPENTPELDLIEGISWEANRQRWIAYPGIPTESIRPFFIVDDQTPNHRVAPVIPAQSASYGRPYPQQYPPQQQLFQRPQYNPQQQMAQQQQPMMNRQHPHYQNMGFTAHPPIIQQSQQPLQANQFQMQRRQQEQSMLHQQLPYRPTYQQQYSHIPQQDQFLSKISNGQYKQPINQLSNAKSLQANMKQQIAHPPVINDVVNTPPISVPSKGKTKATKKKAAKKATKKADSTKSANLELKQQLQLDFACQQQAAFEKYHQHQQRQLPGYRSDLQSPTLFSDNGASVGISGRSDSGVKLEAVLIYPSPRNSSQTSPSTTPID